MDSGLLWTVVGTVTGVVAAGLTAWQVRLQFVEHRLSRQLRSRTEEEGPFAADGLSTAPPTGRHRGGSAVVRVDYHRPAVASQPIRLMPRPVFLVGREQLLVDLGARLAADNELLPRVVALFGLGGAGKTSVAAEYAYRHLDSFGLVWQVSAEEPTALAAAFGELAAQLGTRGVLDAGDPIAQVHGVLAARPGDWLLIFDNAASPSAVQHALPPAGRGQVLITSQYPHWPGSQALEVPVLDQEIAAKFLLARTDSADLAAAQHLATELGGLPLALEQAAAYMQATGRSIAGYLALFQQRRAELLGRGEPAGYSKQVSTSWALTFDRLAHAVPLAGGLLRLLACYAPEQIPFRLLFGTPPDVTETLPAEMMALLSDPLAVDDAVASLRSFSLISPPENGRVSVHRLVQAVTLDQISNWPIY